MALDDAAGAYRVTVCTTATGLSIRDSAGNPVTVQTGKVENYNSYTFTANAGTYTYQADGYGTGVLKVSGDTTVYLREIQYTLQKAGECNFKMRLFLHWMLRSSISLRRRWMRKWRSCSFRPTAITSGISISLMPG